MRLTPLKQPLYTMGGLTLGFLMGSTDCFADALEIIRPVETKANEISTAIVWLYWAVVGVVVGYRIFHISFGDENNRMKHLKALGWVAGGAILIASIAKIIVWLKAGG